MQSGAGADDAGGPAAAGGVDKPGDGDAAVPEYAGADGTGPAAAEGVAGKTGTERDPAGEDAETYQQLLSSGAFTLALTELDALYNDASAYLDLWRSGDTRNYALIYMNAYNILMRVAAASTSAEARDAYLKDAEWLLLDTANVIPLYEKEQAYALRGDVTGVVSDGMGAWYFGALWRVEQ